jgi:hypothetical protein
LTELFEKMSLAYPRRPEESELLIDLWPEKPRLTRGDVNNFWILYPFQNLRLRILRGIKENKWPRVLDLFKQADERLEKIPLPFRPEATGSLLLLRGYYELHQENYSSADAALESAMELEPEAWTSRLYREMAGHLKQDILEKRKQGEKVPPDGAVCKCRYIPKYCKQHSETRCECLHHDLVELCESHSEAFSSQPVTAVGRGSLAPVRPLASKAAAEDMV